MSRRIPPSSSELWQALKDHIQFKDSRFAVDSLSREIMDPGMVIASLGPVAFPLTDAQLAVMKPWFQRLPGDHWQLKALPHHAQRVTMSNEWETYVLRTVRNVAVALGMPVDRVQHALCRVILEEGCDPARPGPIFKTDQALRSEGVMASVTFYLPTTRLQGGQIHLSHSDQSMTVDTSQEVTPTMAIIGSYVDVEQRLDPIRTAGVHRMSLVYGIRLQNPSPATPGHWLSAERLYERQDALRHLLVRWREIGGRAVIHIFRDQTPDLRLSKGIAKYRTSMGLGGPVPKGLDKVTWNVGYPLQSQELQGENGVIVRTLYPIAKELGVGMYMATVKCLERTVPETGRRSLRTEVKGLVRVVDNDDKVTVPMLMDRLEADGIQFIPEDDVRFDEGPDSVAKDGARVYERIALVLQPIVQNSSTSFSG